MTITDVAAHDIRFPTSRTLDGSDAMHTAPDYSAAYVVLKTDSPDGLEGHGLTFTCGRGTEIVVAAINALKPFLAGRQLESITSDMKTFWRQLTSDGQLRWIGPEKGAHPPGDGRSGQRRVGPLRQSGEEARVEAAARHDTRTACFHHRLPLHHRCADARRGARNPAPEPVHARPARS